MRKDIYSRNMTESESCLRANAEQYEALFTNSPEAVFCINEEGIFIRANPACRTITGYEVEELEGMSFVALILPKDRSKIVNYLKEFRLGNHTTSYDIEIVGKDGRSRYINVVHFPMKINGQIVGLYGVARDITEKILYEQQMEQLAFHDSLTKLPNRKQFEDKLQEALAELNQTGHSFAVMFIDLDRFKIINDSFGHRIGDEFLKMVSERLKQCIQKKDTVSRLAGDEFTVLVRKTTREEATRLAEQINHVMAEPFHLEGYSVVVSASIGIVMVINSEISAKEVLRSADTAMYHTKAFRKGSYTFYSKEMDQKASHRLMIENDLKQAIYKEELELYYQPIIALKSNRLVGMEALIRWNHPKLGFLTPAEFIGVAEESGLIISIGEWVIESACQQAKKWCDSGLLPFKVAVNISSKNLQHYSFVDTVARALDKAGLQSEWLELEITESSLFEDADMINENLLKLKEMGVSLSIDDFGAGYTSLSYLRQYPFDKIKIDRCFVEDISRDLNGKRIASAIIQLAHSLNMKVLAEGIENETELKYLLEENCDEGQGFLFSSPSPVHSLPYELMERQDVNLSL